ncbi:kinesin-like protein KIF28P, partial [Xenia sp. Carnegie-2017]|uniref:kinesin-like protein KIF28P n=1 Tax=Xenia sp. Carnegie-2017 TaxID=2897299 RepID=UPI001F042AF1
REKARKAGLIIQMDGKRTTINDPNAPNNPPCEFTFDHCFWSHDGFEENESGYLRPTNPHYADQNKVYNDLGKFMLNNVWAGHNTSLFAYGQSGSGKSWSIFGYGPNKGILPMFCEGIFEKIKKSDNDGVAANFEVQFSMLEIYNEKVHDLLNPSNIKQDGLRIQENPKEGFFVEGLHILPVVSYYDIKDKIEEGIRNRSIAATNKNITSSRAHTIAEITFMKKQKNEAEIEIVKTVMIKMIDLAGSELSDITMDVNGAMDDRVKEKVAINLSLSSLGDVMADLVKKSEGMDVTVPYDSSALTKLLKNVLGGNSKTIMIAAISPSDSNYDETLSTLQCADRAKKIKGRVTINNDPIGKILGELKEERQMLLESIQAAQLVKNRSLQVQKHEQDHDDDDDDDDDELEENSSKMFITDFIAVGYGTDYKIIQELQRREGMLKSRIERLQAMNLEKDHREENLSKLKKIEITRKTKMAKKEEQQKTPHIWNLNADPQLSGMIYYLLKPGNNLVGSEKADPVPEITLTGLKIKKNHAIITCMGNDNSIQSCGSSALLVNGEPVTESIILHHNDRIMFGTNQLYVFYHPQEIAMAIIEGVEVEEVDYAIAQKEIASNFCNVCYKSSDVSKDDLLIQEKVIDIFPMTELANAISEELDKKVKYEVGVLSYKLRRLVMGHPEVFVIMTNLQSRFEWMWSIKKFINRKDLMQEMYRYHEEGHEWDLPDELDPFIESETTEVLIGCVEVYLESICYMVKLHENTFTVIDYRDNEVGRIRMAVVPIKEDGSEVTDNDNTSVVDPESLIGKNFEFVMKIATARGIPKKYTDVYCKYSLFDSMLHNTQCFPGETNPDFFHMEKVSINPCSKKFIDSITKECKPLVVQVWGKQKLSSNKVSILTRRKNTKALMSEAKKKETIALAANYDRIRKRSQELFFKTAQEVAMRKRIDRLEKKMEQLERLKHEKEESSSTTIEISEVRRVLGESDSSSTEDTDASSSRSKRSKPLRRQTRSKFCALL